MSFFSKKPAEPPAPTDGPGNIELVYCRWVNSSKMGFTPLGLTALGQAENKQDAKNKVVAALAAQSIMDPVMNKPAPQGPITRVSYRKTKNGNFVHIVYMDAGNNSECASGGKRRCSKRKRSLKRKKNTKRRRY